MRSIFCSIWLFPFVTFAQLRLAPVFSDHMILQRDQPIVIYGHAMPGHIVSIHFEGIQKNVKAQHDSTWSVQFPAMQGSSKARSLSVRCGSDSIFLNDLVLGDVWVCIGQSNMEFPMIREQHWQEEKKYLQHQFIRLMNPIPAGRNVYTAAYTDSLIGRMTPSKFYHWESWKLSDSNTAKTMSAVAYYFAATVHAQTKIPIGIINLSIGGAPLETFINTNVLQQDPEFSAKVKGNWLLNEALPVWVRERGMQNVGTVNTIPQDAEGPFHAYKPGVAYISGIKPLLSFHVKGILCYQGESNAQEITRVMEYDRLMKLMVDDYRAQWKQPSMAFYYVQLSSIDTTHYKSQLWPEFRNEQRKAMDSLSNTGMVVSSDLGAQHDVHPTNKKDIGERLARWALYKTYQQPILPSGPLPKNATYANGQVYVTFEYIGKGLKTADGAALRGFSIDGKSDVSATFSKEGVSIAVPSKPSYIYYGWKPYSDGNLVNASNLPASTFKIRVQ